MVSKDSSGSVFLNPGFASRPVADALGFNLSKQGSKAEWKSASTFLAFHHHPDLPLASPSVLVLLEEGLPRGRVGQKGP